jgi:hypothetical protein
VRVAAHLRANDYQIGQAIAVEVDRLDVEIDVTRWEGRRCRQGGLVGFTE